ncbi:hypothetical protein HAX54_039601, partial [Datura stramonium]|nr:hypothetical protein [Datura stramonium]
CLGQGIHDNVASSKCQEEVFDVDNINGLGGSSGGFPSSRTTHFSGMTQFLMNCQNPPTNHPAGFWAPQAGLPQLLVQEGPYYWRVEDLYVGGEAVIVVPLEYLVVVLENMEGGGSILPPFLLVV